VKTLPLTLCINGFNYTQILKGERSFIYRQDVTPEIKQFEVFKLMIKPAKILFGKEIPEREVFPSGANFGETAWSFRSYDIAKWRYDELEQGKSRKEFTLFGTTTKVYSE